MVLSSFTRQVLVAVAPQLGAMSIGGSIGFPSILLLQFKSNESSIRPDLDTMTWITSMHGIAGIGAILLPIIMQAKGRKITFIGSCLLMTIGWILAFAAKYASMLLVAEAFLGLGCNCIAIVNLVFVSEMLAPKYRTASLMLLGVSQSLGYIGVTSIGSLVYWKTLALIMCTPLVVASLMIFLWPESPSWLIYKGEIDQCEIAFKWLRGTDEDAKKELQALIVAQRANVQTKTRKSLKQEICEKFKAKDFYLPSLLMLLILSNFFMSGVASLLIYSKYVMEVATGNEKAAMFWFLLVNTTFFFGAFCSLIIIKYFNTKTIFYIGGVSYLFLLAGSLVSYLQYLGIIPTDSLLFIYLFFGYFVLCNSGFSNITFAVAIEIMPVKHRGLGGTLYNIITCVSFFVTVKSLPYMVMYINIWGTFMLYSICGIICTLLIWKYVPETKGRTLQEIEDYYNHGSFVIKRDFDDIMVVSTLIDKEQ